MKPFNASEYIASLSIDCVIFGYQAQQLNVLIAKFKFGQGVWSLPGGYIQKTEGIDQAANRILQERTGLGHIYLEQFRVFGGGNRIVGSPDREMLKSALTHYDPDRFDESVTEWLTGRFICIGYYALVDMAKVNPQAGEFDAYLEWCKVDQLRPMIHDHRQILAAALEALRQNLDRKLIGFNLLPDTFTMRELQQLYEAVYNRAFAVNNFQKKILDLNVLERLQKRYTGAANTAPYLYRFKRG